MTVTNGGIYAGQYPCDGWVDNLESTVKALVRWATGKRLTNRLPKLSLITLPPFEQRDSWSSYGAVRAYSEVLL